MDNKKITTRELIKTHITRNPKEFNDLSYNKFAEFILENDDRFTVGKETLRKVIGEVARENEIIEIDITKDDKYVIIGDTIDTADYQWTAKNGEIQISVKKADKLFYEYSEHGLNLTGTQIINKYGFEVWEWNSIKNTLQLYKKSNIYSPWTVQITPNEELENMIQSKIEASLSDKVNIEAVYDKTVRRKYKRLIESNQLVELVKQKFYIELTELLTMGKYSDKVPTDPESTGKPIGVFLADLHVGAKTTDLHNTDEYNVDIVRTKLDEAAFHINKLQSKDVTLFLIGDLIESFTGLNHKNVWQSMEYGMYGAKVVETFFNLICDFISKVNNVKCIAGIAGNHDRSSADRAVDTKGEIAAIIFKMLDIKFNGQIEIDFDYKVISRKIDGISYIIMHGHTGESKKSAESIILNHGVQGMYNLIVTGHWHTFQVKADSNMHSHIVCPSIFPGNDFSERLGFSSNTGFMTTINNDKNKPNLTKYSI